MNSILKLFKDSLVLLDNFFNIVIVLCVFSGITAEFYVPVFFQHEFKALAQSM